jgi:hypothetical protein
VSDDGLSGATPSGATLPGPTLSGPTPPDPAVLAAITAAVQLAWPRPAPPDEQNPVHEAWRFSGRWWHKPVPVRRDRPWAGGR